MIIRCYYNGVAPKEQRKLAWILILLKLVATPLLLHGFHLHTIHDKKESSYSFSLLAKKPTTAKVQTGSTRQNRVQSLMDWAERSDIQLAKSYLRIQHEEKSGLGLYSQGNIPSGSVVLSVPSKIALSVEAPGEGPNNRAVIDVFGKQIIDLPWFAQMSLYLNVLKQQQQKEPDYQAWIDSLPQSFETPFHWGEDRRTDLQYNFIVGSVKRQEISWKELYDSLSAPKSFSFNDFVWGCECARSRAFSGSYTGGAFNPGLYAFVLLLITIYVGLNLGSLEQAANGAGVVVSVSILKDFVLPKIFKKKRYVICPMIDIVNHKSVGSQADVSFEYFANAYSLAIDKVSSQIGQGEQIYISYGARSNDQLLQYYGFVEPDNPHDVYVMPSLRDWDISAIERACGRQFAPGRLAKLDQAGLLGNQPVGQKDNDDGDLVSTGGGGVVLTSILGIDPAVMQALRVLVSTDDEWNAGGQAIGNFSEENAGGPENETCARIAAKTAIEMELASKPTTIQEDMDLLRRMDALKRIDTLSSEENLAILFRIEKKKLLQKCIDQLL